MLVVHVGTNSPASTFLAVKWLEALNGGPQKNWEASLQEAGFSDLQGPKTNGCNLNMRIEPGSKSLADWPPSSGASR